MRGRVDAARQTADHCQTGVRDLIRKLLRRFGSIVRRPPGADDPDGVIVALLKFTPDVKHDWRRVNFPERPRI